MTRTFQDDDLLLWETYPAAPRAGADRGARIMFHCLTDPARRARVVERDGTRAEAAAWLAGASDAELQALLGTSRPLD